MKINFSKLFKIFFICLCGISIISCKSIRQPSNIQKPINYSDEDMVQNEIKRINNFMGTEPVKALWRASLLGRFQVIKECVDNLEYKAEIAYEEGDYKLVEKYIEAVNAVGFKSKKYTKEQIDKLYKNDVPGLTGFNYKMPKTIEDCINATCTIWVDRGIKIEKDVGYADIIIGSGFFIDDRGYLVTNYHVIDSMVNPKYEGFSRLYIKLPGDMENKIKAKVIGYDKILDLALLKVEIEPKFVFNLGSSEGLHVGDKISAIGTPIGLEGTLTSGIISATDRKLLTLGDVFQLDAAVNSGNSGGPLIDENMNVQAIVFAGMLQSNGLNFAIPVEYLKQILEKMYRDGQVVHPWIGAYGHTKKYGSEKIGLEVQYVVPGGSAKMSGLEPGDIITELGGHEIKSLEDFQFLMLAYEPESILECKYLDKDSNLKKINIYLEERPEAPAKLIYDSDYFTGSFLPLFGMKLVASSTTNKKSFTISDVLVGSAADSLSFSANDVIEIKEVIFDEDNQLITVQVYTKRRKKGYIDIYLSLGTKFDSPYYF